MTMYTKATESALRENSRDDQGRAILRHDIVRSIVSTQFVLEPYGPLNLHLPLSGFATTNPRKKCFRCCRPVIHRLESRLTFGKP